MNDTKNSWENQQGHNPSDKNPQTGECNKNKTGNATGTLKQGVENVADRAGEFGRKAGDSIKQGAEKAADKIGHAVDTAADHLQGKKSY